jgi:hypothetical protein
MAFCYHFKFRIPHPKEIGGKKLLKFKLMVPFKSRRFTGGRFGYSSLGEDTKFFAKAMKFLRHRNYDTL